jgi:uncharacterized membrane protein
MRTTESIRWRGGQVTRIEALTDAVFGFAITLLVVSLEVPQTFDDLMGMMRAFVGFAFSFTLLILVWTYHYRLFSRYDMEDLTTVVLNSILLFVVLFYVYPLKFVASFLLGGARDAFSSWEQVPLLMAIYGAGFVAVFLVFALLYGHAYRLRDRMGLTPMEAHMARGNVANCLVMVGCGLVSIGLALLVPGPAAAPIAGFSYFLIGPAQWFVAMRMQRLAPAGGDTAASDSGLAASSPVEPAEPMPPIHTS